MTVVTKAPDASVPVVADEHVHRGLYELMLRHIDGDWRAFDQLHERLAPRLRGLLLRLVGAHHDVDDLLQMTFLRAHMARARFIPRGTDADLAVIGWYYAIARNTAMESLRQRGRESRRREADGRDDSAEQLADGLPNIEEVTIDREDETDILERLQAALEQLPAGQREVVELHKLKGLSMAEVSKRLEVGEGAVRVRAHRAYKTLLRLLGARRSET